MLKIKEIEAKTSPKKKQIELKNISVENLKLVDTDTGEDITKEVIDAIPTGIWTGCFKVEFGVAEQRSRIGRGWENKIKKKFFKEK